MYTTITRFGFMNFVNFHEHPRDHAAGVSGAVHVAGLGGKDANQQHSDQSGQHAWDGQPWGEQDQAWRMGIEWGHQLIYRLKND